MYSGPGAEELPHPREITCNMLIVALSCDLMLVSLCPFAFTFATILFSNLLDNFVCVHLELPHVPMARGEDVVLRSNPYLEIKTSRCKNVLIHLLLL